MAKLSRTSFVAKLVTKISLLLAAGLLLAACRGNPPAPVTEAGQRQVLAPPLIVSGDAPRPSGRRQAPVVSSSSSAGTASSSINLPATHRVQRGETLFSIAYQYNLDYRTLALANDLQPPYTIFIDQQLRLRVDQPATGGGSGITIGTPVENNSVATARGVDNRSGVLRQPIETVQEEPSWRWPVPGRVLRGFNEAGSGGLDLAGMPGEPVHAAGAGDVVYAGNGIQGAGNLIILRHNDRYLSAYGHNRELLVTEGDRVRAGQQIAEMGRNAGGVPMLHFEVRADGKAVDPLVVLPSR